MKSILKALSVCALAAVAMTATARADSILYSNGPAAGTVVGAWTIGSGLQVADSFSLSGNSTITGADFDLWNSIGDTTLSVSWSILSDAGGLIGGSLVSGTATVTQQTVGQAFNYYDINLDTIGLPDVDLSAGNYWFELQSAVTTLGDAVNWDINGGPSQVWTSVAGYNPEGFVDNANPSDAFTLFGTTTDAPAPTGLPAPGALALLSFGLMGIAGLRRKKSVA